jgi:hypothetical protein
MKVFLCHASEDKHLVEPIGSELSKRGFSVWIDKWSLVPGDSLIGKIEEAISGSDRVVVFLSKSSVEKAWVKKELRSAMTLELGGGKVDFIIPALLNSCDIPLFLRDKLYANFTNKSFSSACDELARGVEGQALGPQHPPFDNRIFRTWNSQMAPDKFGFLCEFGVKLSPSEGLHVGVDVGIKYNSVGEWFAPPNSPQVLNSGGVFYDSATRREDTLYARKFSSPGVTSSRSFYLFFEADQPFPPPKEVLFNDYFNREPGA